MNFDELFENLTILGLISFIQKKFDKAVEKIFISAIEELKYEKSMQINFAIIDSISRQILFNSERKINDDIYKEISQNNGGDGKPYVTVVKIIDKIIIETKKRNCALSCTNSSLCDGCMCLKNKQFM